MFRLGKFLSEKKIYFETILPLMVSFIGIVLGAVSLSISVETRNQQDALKKQTLPPEIHAYIGNEIEKNGDIGKKIISFKNSGGPVYNVDTEYFYFIVFRCADIDRGMKSALVPLSSYSFEPGMAQKQSGSVVSLRVGRMLGDFYKFRKQFVEFIRVKANICGDIHLQVSAKFSFRDFKGEKNVYYFNFFPDLGYKKEISAFEWKELRAYRLDSLKRGASINLNWTEPADAFGYWQAIQDK